MRYRVELYRNVITGQYWWTLVAAGNGKMLAHSESYTTRRAAIDTVGGLVAALGCEFEDRTAGRGGPSH
jgi:uncharacterized protein YegP (UPF0339 family)